MRVLQDLSLSHASPRFPPAADALARGKASEHAALFQWTDAGALLHYGTRQDAPLLDLRSDAAQALAFAVVDAFLTRGVDGFRIDMAAEVPLPLLVALRDRVKRARPEAAMVGELVPTHAWRWLAAEALDAATDFGAFELLRRALVKGCLGGVMASLREQDLRRGGDARQHTVRFLSTHDHVRLATLLARESASHLLPLAYVLLFTLPGIPMLLYGEEVGLASSAADEEPEDAWPDRMPMVFEGVLRDEALRGVVRTLAHLRRRSLALTQGSLEVAHDEDELLVFRRTSGGEAVDILVSLADSPRILDLEDEALPYHRVELLLPGAAVDGSSVTLSPGSAAVIVRTAYDPAAEMAPRVRRNLALLEEDFRDARPIPEARPVRFDFAVTERCNLACLHCITHAPTRTQDGTARTLGPRFLDVLRGDLAYARYAGFVHGGESLTAPIFWDILAALKTARGHEPYVAHLLTNGLLLTESTTVRLVEAGVNSLSVSLDGATEAVSDAIRVGGRFARVTAQLAAVARARAAHGWDLRLGLSYVALDSNVHELSAFVELAARLGVDWVKLEEGAPANAYAARSLLRPDDARLRDAVAQAVLRGRALGLVVVDHTQERPRYVCRNTEEAEADLRADEFANRSDINACRSPWETACIEASGDVRLGDFWGPRLGNLMDAPLVDLFSGPAAREWRMRSQNERVCGPGAVTCLQRRGGAEPTR
jgi:MoaA/NifB/PqqE/SkfB family radical SAM enzyme